jgi:hypothetical protein
MNFQDALKAVTEKNLTKTQLEEYRDAMSLLLMQLQIECSELEKEEALYLANRPSEESIASRKVSWKATVSGQRLIVVKRYISATKTMMTSLRDRLYNFY